MVNSDLSNENSYKISAFDTAFAHPIGIAVIPIRGDFDINVFHNNYDTATLFPYIPAVSSSRAYRSFALNHAF